MFIVAAALWCAAAVGAAAQDGRAELSADERRLVEGSRAAVVAAGLSPEFFDAHFRLERVFARPADRRVVWRLTVGEYETTVNDAVGSYTDEKGARHDTHSVAGRLPEARDIGRTIPRERAEQLMKKCIGAYQDAAVVYEAFGAPPRAALALTAVSLSEPPKDAKRATTPARPSAPPQTGAPPESDIIKQGGKKKPPPRIGRIDLETGKCTVGVGQSGSPHPDADRYARPRQ
jgi:hypothetical protein